MPYSNPEDQKAYARRWYEDNKDLCKRRAAVGRDKAKEEAREYVDSIKDNNPCMDCGVFYPTFVMQFDHLGDKVFDISTMVSNCHSLESIKKEVAKCQLVCANCHAIRTYLRRENILK